MTDPRHELGARAEVVVADWLRRRGWHLLERRWRSGVGELDLVCLDPCGVLVGVEVKLRRSGRAGSGAESLDRRRVARLRAALATYAAASRLVRQGTRLDLVVLTPADDRRWSLSRLPGIDAW